MSHAGNITQDYAAAYEAGARMVLAYIEDRWPALTGPADDGPAVGVVEATEQHMEGVLELLRKPLERRAREG